MYEKHSNNKTSLENMLKQMHHFLTGAGNAGEEKTVWKIFDQLNHKKIQIIEEMELFSDYLDDQIEKLELFTKVQLEFKKEVKTSANELKKNLLSVNRDVADNHLKNEKVINQFEKNKLTMDSYPIIIKADSVKSYLLRMQKNYELMEDSLISTSQNFDSFLAGDQTSKKGITARQFYERILNKGNEQLKEINSQPDQLIVEQKKLEDLNDLILEFKEVLNDIDQDIVFFDQSIRDEEEKLVADSLRYSSLFERMPKGFTKNSFPYNELEQSFSNIQIKLIKARDISNDLKKIKTEIITHVGKMDGIKRDPSLYNNFNAMQKSFSEVKKNGEKIIEELDDSINLFHQVIIDNFLNTPEFWALKYNVTEESSRRKEKILKENFGYLQDMNRFRGKKYHGHFVSDFELKLIKKGNNNPTFQLIFSGKNDFFVGGVKILNKKGELFVEINRDSIQSKLEDEDDKIVNFEWTVDINENILSQIVNESEHTVRILYITVTNRINLTGYSTKIYKEYRIPQVRLQSWKRIIGIDETLS
ncbi:MAG: hypothetical protein CMG75_00285 [Candidatus Marinimicrobia bacterium]|nr:hypothetical protein [Candidatus Neomarinimicrobiota bacterium]|tara:strand:- start:7417 stop:9012 length:1596 start_codon:yes stop_codon:yes gene_type:complete